MKKVKFISILFIMALFFIFMPNISNAAVEYTRTFPSNEGTIKINFTDLSLDPTQAYEFALVRQGGTPESWFSIDDGYTETTATVTLSSANSTITAVLKATDTGYIYMRKKDDTTGEYVLNAHQVDLKLPYLQSLEYIKGSDYYDITVNSLYGEIGAVTAFGYSSMTYYAWQKVSDKELIEDFLNIKNSNGELIDLENSLLQHPSTGYTEGDSVQYDIKNDGLYLLWVYRTGEGCKNVYSCIVHDGLPDATTVDQYIAGLDVEKPTVESIKVTSPESGTYKTGQTVKLTVTFSEDITGSTVPTLKIRFGTSEERTVTNGTISGKTIVYSYNIVDGDKGQLAVTGYTGGTIKDASGNDATITAKTVSGHTIKANVEGTTTNNTENQDQTNNQINNENTDNETTNNNQEKQEDTTTAQGKLPQTGIGFGLITALISMIGVGVFAYFKYNKLKGI